MNTLVGKNVTIGVTGSIAAYKSCELVRNLVKEDISVQVIMTKNAANFITPLTLQTLSGKKVATDAFDLGWESEIGHIHLADSTGLIVVAPASASFIGKLANGITDNLLSTVIIASKAPVLICPAMNVNMYNNPLVQDNIKKLKKSGIIFIEPYEGDLACGWEGRGRLADISDISNEIFRILYPDDLKGKNVLVTTGATREFIDPLRFISNPSSGKMGFSIAQAAWLRGADVTLISAHTDSPPPYGIKIIEVENANDMYKKVMSNLKDKDIIIKAAAVSDYKVKNKSLNKIKKSSGNISLELSRTKDILKEIGQQKNGAFIVGFAAETENLIENSAKKLKNKKADLIVANNISQEGAGFEVQTNIVSILNSEGKIIELPLMSKADLGHKILDIVIENNKN
ncbi:MAG: bifunctional phosphopantothenoylcysteine decarboxylase/phosphopantothenate--cysteine ligase CoaBC [Thermodesulfobacteriota bacterium]